jgi:streptogramin lyase
MGGALGQNGMIYLIPRNSTVVGKINPMTNIYTTFGSVSSGVDLYCTGVFAPNGLIYCISQNSGTFATINPATDTYTTISGTVQGGGGYYSACLAPNGVIYIIPCNATTIATITISGLTQLPSLTYCLSAYANKF